MFSLIVKSFSKKSPFSSRGNILQFSALTTPSDIFSMPDIIFSKVDFPAPFLPIIPYIFPLF